MTFNTRPRRNAQQLTLNSPNRILSCLRWMSSTAALLIASANILKLRNKAKKQLGEKFNMKAFHDEWSHRDASDIDGSSREADLSGNE